MTSRTPAKIGRWLLAAIMLVALLAPLLADDKPLLVRTAGHWSSPVARSLANPRSSEAPGVNAVFNAALLVLPLALIGLSVRRILRFDRRRWLVGTGVVAAAAISVVSIWMLQQRPINFARLQYKQKAAAPADGDWYLFPPVAFSPARGAGESPLEPASWRHPLGTDAIGRDVLTRILHGARISLAVGLASVLVSMLVGVTLGALAGYFRGWVDSLIMRTVEVFICFPVLVLILTLLAFWRGASLLVLMLVIGLTGWTKAARQVRGEFLRQRALDYVAAAEALGVRPLRVVFVHVLPNAIQPALVTATFGVAAAILYESTLSFLGLGVPPPAPSWGGMIYDASRYVGSHPQLALWPGLAIFLTIVSYNLVGEGLRDALDPKLRQ